MTVAADLVFDSSTGKPRYLLTKKLKKTRTLRHTVFADANADESVIVIEDDWRGIQTTMSAAAGQAPHFRNGMRVCGCRWRWAAKISPKIN